MKGRLCPSIPPVDHCCVFWHLPLIFTLFTSIAFHSFSSNFCSIVWGSNFQVLEHASDDLKHFTMDNQLETASNGKFSQGTHFARLPKEGENLDFPNLASLLDCGVSTGTLELPKLC
ncbi:hypothetical protein DVH24_029978 [Malus domestica]|uniref:Uncharacterized protein n=1 Tax=Malus domestica TaxID=3750 RepID=A0A498I061_MALDO|nr:hypothetical protein DVH24_029978 [Malus domestica]